MSKVEGGGGPIDTPPPSGLCVTIFSSRLLGLNDLMLHVERKYHIKDQ